MASSRQIGDKGETAAADFLEAEGYRVMDRNYHFEHHELDLVCFDPAANEGRGELVFVEVKTRSSLGFGAPEEAVDAEKQQNLAEVARAYLYERHLEGAPARFDVVTVLLQNDKPPEIAHHPNAFLP